MTSSTIPSPRRPSDGASLLSRSSRGWPSASDAKRLTDHDGLGTAAADPALDRAVRMDEPGRARARRRRPPDRDDRGDHEGLPGRLQFGGADED